MTTFFNTATGFTYTKDPIFGWVYFTLGSNQWYSIEDLPLVFLMRLRDDLKSDILRQTLHDDLSVIIKDRQAVIEREKLEAEQLRLEEEKRQELIKKLSDEKKAIDARRLTYRERFIAQVNKLMSDTGVADLGYTIIKPVESTGWWNVSKPSARWSENYPTFEEVIDRVLARWH